MIAGQPQIDVRRPNFRQLSKRTRWSVRFYSMNDEQLSLNRLCCLMSDRRRVTVAKLGERELALRRIDLLSSLFSQASARCADVRSVVRKERRISLPLLSKRA